MPPGHLAQRLRHLLHKLRRASLFRRSPFGHQRSFSIATPGRHCPVAAVSFATTSFPVNHCRTHSTRPYNQSFSLMKYCFAAGIKLRRKNYSMFNPFPPCSQQLAAFINRQLITSKCQLLQAKTKNTKTLNEKPPLLFKIFKWIRLVVRYHP